VILLPFSFDRSMRGARSWRAAAVLVVVMLMEGLMGPRVVAQALPDSVVQVSVRDACRHPAALRPLLLLQWQTSVRPVEVATRAGFTRVEREAYRIVEQHLVPYRDPQMSSTWVGKPYAVVQPSLRVDVAPDTSFARWERLGYALELNWDDPPLVSTQEVSPFRPRLASTGVQLLYAGEPYATQLIRYFLPLRRFLSNDALRERIDCVDDAMGLIDWVERSDRAHSPPHVSLLFNQRLDRAIVGYGWGDRGGVFVAYRRVGIDWREIRPIGSWRYGE
jgi:hypothetical protein